MVRRWLRKPKRFQRGEGPGNKNGRTRLWMRPVKERTELLFLLADAASDHLPRRSVPEEQTAYLDRTAVGHADAAIG